MSHLWDISERYIRAVYDNDTDFYPAVFVALLTYYLPFLGLQTMSSSTEMVLIHTLFGESIVECFVSFDATIHAIRHHASYRMYDVHTLSLVPVVRDVTALSSVTSIYRV